MSPAGPSLRARRTRRPLLAAAAAGLAAALAAPLAAVVPAAAAPTRAQAPAPAPRTAPASEQALAAAQVAAAATPVLRWRPCGDGVQCATARVPLDYDRPRGRTIALALAKVPATQPARRIGTLFLNPGGPGGSGVDFVRGVATSLYSDEVRARFDLVGFDPRGIARSTPVRCFESLDDAFAATAPVPFPVTPAEERQWIAADRRIAAACTERAGAVIDHVTTADVARDMDLLRRAVGDRRTTFAGYSYGSFVGSTYAALFPSRVRAVVVDGVIDPVQWTTGVDGSGERVPVDVRLRSDQGAYETLRRMLALCDAGGESCLFSAGDPQRRFDRLAARLRAEPAQLPDGQGGTVPFTYNELVSLTLGALYDPAEWPALAELYQVLDELTRGRASSAAGAGSALADLRAALGVERSSARAEEYDNVVEGAPSVICSDSDNPATYAAWRRATAEADRRWPYFGRAWGWLSSVCQSWPGQGPDRYAGPFDVPTADPVLVVGTRYDPATRYQDAVSTARRLPGSRLLTLDGQGHTSLFASSCVDAKVSAYLLRGALPAAGTRCAPDAVPFADAPRALAAADRPGKAELLLPPLLAQQLAGR
ncbi:alpha/beta hydrolase [Vallicoccus soli]|uniref:Alpha/beta fold hydrolase n=1 Tax=Vallicoccus soli TaxID=2339232 RepID=A0A3A3ZIY4_9ACTN|nr:alpha/beta hydrolase [Vallicoccus soli]RJK95442.1 alpha/beta fold hydrolase [Vallicoccus soli]